MVGRTYLAVPAYEKALELSEAVQQEAMPDGRVKGEVEDFAQGGRVGVEEYLYRSWKPGSSASDYGGVVSPLARRLACFTRYPLGIDREDIVLVAPNLIELRVYIRIYCCLLCSHCSSILYHSDDK